MAVVASGTKVAVIFHSGQGHTAALAHAVVAGIEASGASATLFDADAAIARLEELERYDGLVFGSPTYMGSASANFKHFMEESRLARIFAAQHGMLWVSLGLQAGNNSSTGSTDDLNRLGSFLGAMAQSNADQSSAFSPPQSDRDTAYSLGQRVAVVAHQMRLGMYLSFKSEVAAL